MIQFYACDSCLTVVRVSGDHESMPLVTDHSLWKDGHPCVRTECSSQMYRLKNYEGACVMDASKYGVFRILNLTAEECFSAMCGYGLPGEVGSEPENVKALLLSSAIVDVSTCTSPSGKTVLDRLDLNNGVSLYLAASSYGPVVFKITRRRDARTGNDIGALQQDAANDNVRRLHQCDQNKCRGKCGGTRSTTAELGEHRNNDGEYDLRDTQATQDVPECQSDDATWDDEADTIRTNKSQRIRIGRENEGSDQR